MMKKYAKTGFIAILLSMQILLPILILTPHEVEAKPISSSDFGTSSLDYTPFRKTALVNNTQYIFYEAAGACSCIVYIYKAETNTTWSNSIYLTGNIQGDRFSVKANSTVIHAAYVHGSNGVTYITMTPDSSEQLTVNRNVTLSNQPTTPLGVNVGWNSTGFPVVITGDSGGTPNAHIWFANNIAGSSFQTPITSWTFAATENPTYPTTCSLGNGNVLFVVGDNDNLLRGRIFYQTNQSLGNIFSFGTIFSAAYNYNAICTPSTSTGHVYFIDGNDATYMNVSSAGMPSLSKVVQSSGLTGVALTTDNSTKLIFATAKDESIRQDVYTIGGTSETTGFMSTTGSATLTNIQIPETLTNSVMFIAYVNGGNKLEYSLYSTNTNSYNLHFYDGAARDITPQNITLLRLSDQNSLEIITSSSTVTTSLRSGYYNVTSIFRNGYDLKDNVTVLFISPAFLSQSLIVHNVSLTMNFYDEVTLEPYVMVKDVSFYFQNTQANFDVISDSNSTLTKGLAEIPTQLSVSFGATKEYIRWFIVNSTAFEQTINIYLINHTNHDIGEYTIALSIDPGLVYTNGYFYIQVPTAQGLVTVYSNSIGPDRVIDNTPLIKEHRYRMIAYSENYTASTEIGNHIAGDTTRNIVLTLGNVKFSDTVEFSQQFIAWSVEKTNDPTMCPFGADVGPEQLPNRCNIRVQYRDNTATTTELLIRIYNSSGLQYATTTASSNFTLDWTGASTNQTYTYWVYLQATTTKFGVFSETLTAIPSDAEFPLIDLGITTQSCVSTSTYEPPFECWRYDAISILLAIFIFGMFGALNVDAGAMISMLSYFMFSAWGWTPNTPTSVFVVLFLVVMLYVLGGRTAKAFVR